jgi:hypothetical protein
MTLGKIERFWKTIFNEFLSRAQFDSFENAQDRIRFWIKYYNYKRPHQGIGGLCPADRFFEIQSALKKTLEKGIQENVLEMALRGKPKSPFYMVGRLGDQSVVIRAEKGKVKMMVDGKEEGKEQEIEYDMAKGEGREGEENQSLKEGERKSLIRSGEVPGGAVGVVPVPETLGGDKGDEDPMDGASKLGASRVKGDDGGVRTEKEENTGTGAESTADAAFDPKSGKETDTGEPLRKTAYEDSGIEVWQGGEESLPDLGKEERISDEQRGGEPESEKEGGSDFESESRPDDREGSGEGAQRLEEDVLRVGAERASGDDGSAIQPSAGPTCEEEGLGEGEAEGGGGGSQTPSFADGADERDPVPSSGASELERSGSRKSLSGG